MGRYSIDRAGSVTVRIRASPETHRFPAVGTLSSCTISQRPYIDDVDILPKDPSLSGREHGA